MIKPASYWALHKTCDPYTLGRVAATLGGQTVEPPLNPAEQALVSVIRADSDWMDERIEAKRERWAKAKRANRAANGAEPNEDIEGHARTCEDIEGHARTCEDMRGHARTCEDIEGHARTCEDMRGHARTSEDIGGHARTSEDKRESSNVLSHPSIHPSVHPSVRPPSKDGNITRTVPVRGCRGNGNGNGTGNSEGLAEVRRAVDAFKAAYRADKGAFFDPEHPAQIICIALTDDYKSATRWCQLVRQKGDARIRDEAFAFYSELLSGEAVENRGATLNARLGKLPDLKPEETAGETNKTTTTGEQTK